MKKFLLSALLLGAGVAAASAQSFDFYVTNTATRETNDSGMEIWVPKDYVKVEEGKTYEITNAIPYYVDDSNPDDYYAQYQLMAYTKIVNHTSSELTVNINCQLDGQLATNISDFGYDAHLGFAHCVGGQCVQGDPFDATVSANSETETAVGEHIGYEMEAYKSGLIDQITMEATYNVTVKNGSEVLNFKLHYAKTAGAAVDEIGASDAPAVFYNLQGIQVATPEAGQLYIKRQGNKVSKVIF